jgi:predicted negative regulator of RcsB-dependent stress response
MMAVYDLEEQEQLDEIKAWWKQYRSVVLLVVVAAAVTVGAIQGWLWDVAIAYLTPRRTRR